MKSAGMEYFRSLAWADYLFNLLAEPRKFTRMILREDAKPLPGAVAVAFSAVLADQLAVTSLGVPGPFAYYGLTYGTLLMFLVMCVKLLVLACLVDLLCQFLGYAGRVRELVALAGYAMFPQVLILPIIHIFRVFHAAAPFFYVLFSLALFVWSALIVAVGVSETHSVPFSRAALIFLFPFALAGAIAFLCAVLVSLIAFGYLSNI